MKSLKGKKCVVCGKPATTWFPREEMGKFGEMIIVDRPHCNDCCEQTLRETIEKDDDDDDLLLGGGYEDDLDLPV